MFEAPFHQYRRTFPPNSSTHRETPYLPATWRGSGSSSDSPWKRVRNTGRREEQSRFGGRTSLASVSRLLTKDPRRDVRRAKGAFTWDGHSPGFSHPFSFLSAKE